MNDFSKDGRKLRPRRRVAQAEPVSYGEHKPYGERRSSGEGEHRSFGDRKPYGERKSYGAGRPSGDHKPFGDRKPYGDRPSGEHKSFGGRKSFGDRKPAGRKPFGKGPGFNRKSDEGIRRMIASSPKKEAPSYNFDDFEAKEVVRLNKYIANSGVCSRREADTMILAGVVTVNGEVVTELGTKVNVRTDVVKFNGETLRGEARVYLVMNKPKGYVTTASDPHADKTVMDLIKNCPARVYPVGRLDKATTGVLMFTNDGEIAERLTHPSYDKKKIYQVILNKPFTEEERQQVLAGITLNDGDIAADALEFIDEDDHRKLGIEIHSGKNRIVRRIFEHFGYDVRGLDRVYFAGLTKKGLKKGEWRYLTEGEVNILKMGAYV
ncbi:MAG: rRNA pseudouridine synthase [Bacteroidales bacterium]|nr:rRNA pseudouridine synthase [Bacteroidales bacterium]